METLVAAIIAAAAGIIAAIITAVASNRKHDKNLAVHSKESEKDHAEIKKDISHGRDYVVGAINTAGKEVGEVRTTLTTLKDKFIESEAEKRVHFLSLSDAQRRLYTSAEDMGKFAAEFSALVAENKQLREENMLLSRKVAKLAGQLENERIQHESTREDDEMERE